MNKNIKALNIYEYYIILLELKLTENNQLLSVSKFLTFIKICGNSKYLWILIVNIYEYYIILLELKLTENNHLLYVSKFLTFIKICGNSK